MLVVVLNWYNTGVGIFDKSYFVLTDLIENSIVWNVCGLDLLLTNIKIRSSILNSILRIEFV